MASANTTRCKARVLSTLYLDTKTSRSQSIGSFTCLSLFAMLRLAGERALWPHVDSRLVLQVEPKLLSRANLHRQDWHLASSLASLLLRVICTRPRSLCPPTPDSSAGIDTGVAFGWKHTRTCPELRSTQNHRNFSL